VNRVGAVLDHVTQFRAEADFVKLCDALSATHQQHVVRQYLTQTQAPDAADVVRADEPRDLAAVSSKYSVQGSIVGTWRTVLVQSRSAIIDVLDSSDEFISRLVKYGVMNFATGELCRVSRSLRPLLVQIHSPDVSTRSCRNILFPRGFYADFYDTIDVYQP